MCNVFRVVYFSQRNIYIWAKHGFACVKNLAHWVKMHWLSCKEKAVKKVMLTILWNIIIIIIMSRRLRGYPWPSPAISPYHPSPPVGLQGYIPCKMFRFVPLLSIAGVHRSTFLISSSLLLQQCPACLVRRTCIVFVMGGKCPYNWIARTCLILLSTFLYNFRPASFPAAS